MGVAEISICVVGVGTLYFSEVIVIKTNLDLMMNANVSFMAHG